MQANDILNAAKRSNPDFITGPHHLLVAEALAAVTPISRSRLLIALPPRFSKTSLMLAFTDAFMDAYPDDNVFLAMTTDSTAAEIKRTAPRSRRTVAGLSSRIPAFTASIVVVDDPLNWSDYHLPATQREHRIAAAVSSIQQNWRQRLRPGGGIVVAASRFAADDVFARLEATGEFGVLSIPAMMDGASTWPAFWSDEALAVTAAAIGPTMWAAAYQQNPLPA